MSRAFSRCSFSLTKVSLEGETVNAFPVLVSECKYVRRVVDNERVFGGRTPTTYSKMISLSACSCLRRYLTEQNERDLFLKLISPSKETCGKSKLSSFDLA